MTGRVLVAMSGGVDSSVAAAVLGDCGVVVVGVWMRGHDVADTYSEFRRSCCSADAAEDARRVAGQLGIPFFVLNLEREFDAGVLQPFLRGYQEGRTPSPCIDCNTYVKFGALLGRARLQYDCDAVATGHYARVDGVEDPGRPGGTRYRLRQGLDGDKDQSYFLYDLRQDQLARTRFPLGELTKPQVRSVARALGLATADKAESQEICFVPGGDYREALRERAGWRETPGPLLDVDGTHVGTHRGAAAYTVGQRTGLGVALGERRYVRSIDAAANIVRLGRREELQSRVVAIDGVSFVAGHPPDPAGFVARVRIRHRGPLVEARLVPRDVEARLVPRDVEGSGGVRQSDWRKPDGRQPDGRQSDGRWRAELEQPVWAPAPGQAAVFYAGDEVLGGGRIVAADA